MNPIENHSIFQIAIIGAVKGFFFGTTIGVTIIGEELALSIPERINRSMGYESKWPIYDRECQLEQFRELLFCKISSYCVVCISGGIGTVVGAISAVTQHIFCKPPV